MSTADKSESAQRDERTSLEHVRELLFGSWSRDTERRIARLDARLAGELSAIRDEMQRRFGDLEAHVREEIEALSARIDAEATARVDASSSGARGERELRRQLLDMTRELGVQIGRVRQDLFAAIDRSAEREPAEVERTAEPESSERPSLH